MSKIILGTMQYGLKGWAAWVLDEEEAVKHIKYAYVPSAVYSCPRVIERSTFAVTTQVSRHSTLPTCVYTTVPRKTFSDIDLQVYSNGHSEIILGNAIKKLGLPREELVIMTKVHGALSNDPNINILRSGKTPEDFGVINQRGLNRKVGPRGLWRAHTHTHECIAAHL